MANKSTRRACPALTIIVVATNAEQFTTPASRLATKQGNQATPLQQRSFSSCRSRSAFVLRLLIFDVGERTWRTLSAYITCTRLALRSPAKCAFSPFLVPTKRFSSRGSVEASSCWTADTCLIIRAQKPRRWRNPAPRPPCAVTSV